MTETEYVCPVGHVLADPTTVCETCVEMVRLMALHAALSQRIREIWPALGRRHEYGNLVRDRKKIEALIEADFTLRGHLPVGRWRWSYAVRRWMVRSALRRRGSAWARRA
jgi:hypothetical protein